MVGPFGSDRRAVFHSQTCLVLTFGLFARILAAVALRVVGEASSLVSRRGLGSGWEWWVRLGAIGARFFARKRALCSRLGFSLASWRGVALRVVGEASSLVSRRGLGSGWEWWVRLGAIGARFFARKRALCSRLGFSLASRRPRAINPHLAQTGPHHDPPPPPPEPPPPPPPPPPPDDELCVAW